MRVLEIYLFHHFYIFHENFFEDRPGNGLSSINGPNTENKNKKSKNTAWLLAKEAWKDACKVEGNRGKGESWERKCRKWPVKSENWKTYVNSGETGAENLLSREKNEQTNRFYIDDIHWQKHLNQKSGVVLCREMWNKKRLKILVVFSNSQWFSRKEEFYFSSN